MGDKESSRKVSVTVGQSEWQKDINIFMLCMCDVRSSTVAKRGLHNVVRDICP